MDREKQIEEMAFIALKNVMTYTCAKQIAINFYNAGYRKVRSDEKGNLLKIQDLLVEFDEMGFEPTSLCDNPEQTAKQWKQNLMYEIGLLLDEYTAIRLKAVKEFAEKLKEKGSSAYVFWGNREWYDSKDIDKLLEEYEK